MAAVHVRSLNRLDGALSRAVDADAEASERLRVAVRCYLSFAAENPAGFRLMGTTAGFDHPDVRRVRRQRFENLARNWGGGTGARLLARGMIDFLEGATAAWIEAGAPDLEAVADLLYTSLWLGLSTADSSARHQYQAATLR